MPLTLPFAHLNLRHNPFGEPAPRERAQVYLDDLVGESVLTSLLAGDHVLQLVGDSGRGKTSHLRALEARFWPRAAYVMVPEDARVAFPLGGWGRPGAEILLVDELQFLPARRRARLFRRAETLVFASHEDHSAELDRARRRYTHQPVGGAVTADRLERLVERRLEWARRGPGPLPAVSREGLERLVARFGDDLRGIQRHLYDVFQQLEEIDRVEV